MALPQRFTGKKNDAILALIEWLFNISIALKWHCFNNFEQA